SHHALERRLAHGDRAAIWTSDDPVRTLRRSIHRLARIFRDRHGMSLTELLVSCGVLGMVMAAVGGVVATSGKISTDGDNRAQAQQAARAGMMMEEDQRLAGSGFPPSVFKLTGSPSTSGTLWDHLRRSA